MQVMNGNVTPDRKRCSDMCSTGAAYETCQVIHFKRRISEEVSGLTEARHNSVCLAFNMVAWQADMHKSLITQALMRAPSLKIASK